MAQSLNVQCAVKKAHMSSLSCSPADHQTPSILRQVTPDDDHIRYRKFQKPKFIKLSIYCFLFSADRCRRYVAINRKGSMPYGAPSKFIPRRRALDEDLTCFSLDSASDFAFETSNCLVFAERASSSSKSLPAPQGKADCAPADAPYPVTHLEYPDRGAETAVMLSQDTTCS